METPRFDVITMSKEFKPETRIVYWNRRMRELWEPRIRRISQLYHTAEVATFIAGMRQIYIYHVNSHSFDSSYQFLRENDLLFYPTNKTAVYQGFSHTHPRPVPGQPFQMYGACVKREDRDIGELFLELNAVPDHAEIGKLLGYPDCCIAFFGEEWGDSIDPIWESAVRAPDASLDGTTVTVRIHPFANNTLRYFGVRLTPHLPCSTQCEDTLKWGKEWFKIMMQLDEEAAGWLWELLAMPSTWDCHKGIAIVETPVFRGVTNSDMKEKRHIVRNLGWVGVE